MGLFTLSPAVLISRVIILMIAFSVHEFSHGMTAYLFGDDTAKRYGRLTLNPLAHLDIMGTLLLLVAGFGWAKPVPVDAYTLRRRSPSALMWVSLAGPLSNFVLAILAALPLRFGLVQPTYTEGFFPSLYIFLLQFIIINLSLMLFNLIPIAPLDGEKIAEYLFPPSWQNTLDRIRQVGPIILLAVLFVLPLIGIDLLNWILGPIMNLLLYLLIG